jgi:hypothetical protein
MNCDWEIGYLDDEKLVLRHLRTGRLSPMIVFDSAEMHGWKVGDVICVEGAQHGHRVVQQQMGKGLMVGS